MGIPEEVIVREQLETWLKELGLQEGQFRISEEGEGGPGQPASYKGCAILCTATHAYHLHYTNGYLGATARSRIARAGEDWLRGNDLPDGPFSRETFDYIVRAILVHVVVQLEPVHQPVAVQSS